MLKSEDTNVASSKPKNKIEQWITRKRKTFSQKEFVGRLALRRFQRWSLKLWKRRGKQGGNSGQHRRTSDSFSFGKRSRFLCWGIWPKSMGEYNTNHRQSKREAILTLAHNHCSKAAAEFEQCSCTTPVKACTAGTYTNIWTANTTIACNEHISMHTRIRPCMHAREFS